MARTTQNRTALQLAAILLGAILAPYGGADAAPRSGNSGEEGKDGYWSSMGWPSVRYGHTAVHDSLHDQLIVFGGYDGTNYPGDVWTLTLSDPVRWTLLDTRGLPLGRYTHSAIYDPLRDQMIVFAGHHDGHPRNDVTVLSLSGAPTW